MVLFRYSALVSGSGTAKIFLQSKRNKFVVYHFSGRFKSVHEVHSVLCAELDQVLSDEDSDYNVSYFEG